MKSLIDLYKEHQGKVSDKWFIYLVEYDRIFSDFRMRPVRMLEIGIQNGGSLEIWSKYFPNAQAIIGCDINPGCVKLTYDDARIKVVVGDANTDSAERVIFGHSANFDLIIDDGSHTSSDIVKSFARYFPYLNDGGLFVAEDLHCSYWQEFEGGMYYPYSSLAFFKCLADVVNHEHWGIDKTRSQLFQGFADKFSIDLNEKELAKIHSIEFFNSVCVVRKHQVGANVLGERLVAGVQELVKTGHHSLTGVSQAPSQVGNIWSAMNLASGEALHQLNAQITTFNQAVAERDCQITNLNQAVAEREQRIGSLLHELQALRQSTSWRVTAPLRWMAHQVKRINHFLTIAPSVIRQGGGMRSTLIKSIRILRNEGIIGIRRRLSQGARNDYQEWIKRYDMLDDATRQRMRDNIKSFTRAPKISVLMPVYDPPLQMLDEAINSVRTQLYPEWELCIADDASKNPSVRKLIETHAAQDKRIKVAYRESNGHISATSNTALAMATGEFVALLDHDDLLSEHALFWVAETINRHPDAGLVYSDEDKVNESGLRFDPYFKCDWNYDLFLSQNMICHLGVYQTQLLRQIGGFREGLEGSQDYDLALRCIEQLDASQILHIPRVLYHWRTHADSTALFVQAKPYAYQTAEHALNDHLARKDVSAWVERRPKDSFYRVRYALPERVPLVTLIIPTRNSLQLIRQCLSSILEKTDYPNYEILVVDNGSDDPQTLAYFDTVKNDPRLRILRDDRPFNYSALNNRAVQVARGELVGLINNDIEVISREWLTEMVSIALQPGVGAVGARLWYPDNTLQHGGVILVRGVAGHSHKHLPKGHPGYFARAMLQQTFSAVSAACLVVRRSIFLEVRGLEEENLKVAFNDVDFCLRVREAGYRNVWTPYAELYHHESASRGYEDTPEKQARFAGEVRYMQERWGSLLFNDPAYSPNLTLDHEDFSYAWPPRVGNPEPGVSKRTESLVGGEQSEPH